MMLSNCRKSSPSDIQQQLRRRSERTAQFPTQVGIVYTLTCRRRAFLKEASSSWRPMAMTWLPHPPGNLGRFGSDEQRVI